MYVCNECGKTFEVKRTFSDSERILCCGCKRKETYRKSPELSEKRVSTYKQNAIKKYGVDNPNKHPSIKSKVRKKLKEAFENEERKDDILSKRRETCVSKYGADHHMKNDEVKQRCFAAQIENGGIGFQRLELLEPAQEKAHSEAAYNKRHETCLERYGAKHHFQNKEVLDRQWDSYKESTGYDHPAKNPEVINTSKRYYYKETWFDSSWELAYYIWLEDNGKKFIYHPGIYMDYIDDDGKERKYQPDFLVEGKFVEIKGDHFFNDDGEPYNRYGKFFWWNKYNKLIENNVEILKADSIRHYLRYIKEKYGKSYLKSFKVR